MSWAEQGKLPKESNVLCSKIAPRLLNIALPNSGSRPTDSSPQGRLPRGSSFQGSNHTGSCHRLWT